MYKNNRIKQIESFLKYHGSANVKDLSHVLNVSEMTVRRDLNILVEQGKAIRTHGGAVLPKEQYVGEIHMDSRSLININEKKQIALEASKHIHSGDNIFIDDSSTATAIIEFIPHNKQLTITTTSIWVALQFNNFPNIDVISIGGSVSKNTKSVTGPIAVELLSKMFFKTAFIGVPYITANGIITTNSFEEAVIKRTAIEQSDTSILLIDNSKVHDKPLHVKLATIHDFNLIITDNKIKKEFSDYCYKENVPLIISSK